MFPITFCVLLSREILLDDLALSFLCARNFHYLPFEYRRLNYVVTKSRHLGSMFKVDMFLTLVRLRVATVSSCHRTSARGHHPTRPRVVGCRRFLR